VMLALAARLTIALADPGDAGDEQVSYDEPSPSSH